MSALAIATSLGIPSVFLIAGETGPAPSQMADAQDSTLARFLLEGTVTIGWRQVAVSGSQAQYDEDVNHGDGLVLRELSLHGRSLDAASDVRSFSLDANGVGDPAASVAAAMDTVLGRAIATYDRTSFSATTTSDLHPFVFTRERARLRLETAGDAHAGIDASWSRGDGLAVGTRSVDFGFVSGFPVRRRDESIGIGADGEMEIAGFDVRVEGGIERLETSDQRDFAERSPSDPSQLQTESFDADGHRTLTRAGLRARREMLDRRLVADFGASIASTDGADALHSFETGILFAAKNPFERTTDGATDASAQDVDLDLGARYAIDADTAVSARLRHTNEDQRGSVTRTSVLFEPATGSTSELTETQSLRFASRSDVAEIGVESALGDSAELDLSLSAGRVHEIIDETFDGAPQHTFDDTLDELGGEARVTLEATSTSTCSLSAGYDIAPTNSPLSAVVLSFEDERGRFAELRWRARPARGVEWGASVRHNARDIDAFGSDYDSNAVALHASYARSSTWRADASWTARQFDLRADTTKLFLDPLPTQTPAVVRYEGVEQSWTVGVERDVGPTLRARLAASAAIANGDSELRYGVISFDLPWRPAPRRLVGVELDLHRFDGRGELDASDYTSLAAVVYAGFSF